MCGTIRGFAAQLVCLSVGIHESLEPFLLLPETLSVLEMVLLLSVMVVERMLPSVCFAPNNKLRQQPQQ